MIKYQGISTLEVLKEANNYNKWIAKEILANVSYPSLEIGSGTGNLTSYLLQGKPLYVTDCDEGLVKYLSKKFSDKNNVFIKLFDISKKPPSKFNSFFSSVFAINVLEHIENDIQALKNIRQILRVNGKLILLVPAKKFAYSKLDKELGHYRRYEKKELSRKLITNGYKIEKMYYFNIVGLLSWYVRDKVYKKNVGLTPFHIRIFDSVVPLLRIMESIITIPMGISLIVVARKD